MIKPRQSAKWALGIGLLSIVLGWIFFTTGLYTDLMTDAGRGDGEWMAGVFYPSTYLFLAAIAVFAIGSLMAKKKIQQLSSSGEMTALAKPVHRFANAAIITSLAISAWAAVGLFIDSFLDPSAEVDISQRVLSAYLPIILYTALIVIVLLAGFVFNREPATNAVPHETITNAQPVGSTAQRSTALAYAVPIIAVAVALIFGLIVFDVTTTAPQVWIWVLIQVFIAAGIIAGTFSAKRAMQALASPGVPPTGASVGAKMLNFVLSIIFVAAVGMMSLGYSASAVSQLHVSPSLWLSAYTTDGDVIDSPEPAPISDVEFMINGSDLKHGSTVTVTLEPESIPVVDGLVDRDGYVNMEEPLPADIDEGEHVLTVRATTTDERELTAELQIAVTDTDTIELPQGSDANSPDSDSRLVPASPAWFFSELAPAFLLIILVTSAIYVTVTIRNPDQSLTHASGEASSA